MQSKVFFPIKTLNIILEDDRLKEEQFLSGNINQLFKERFGFLIESINLNIKEEVLKYDGFLNNHFTLFVVRKFSSTGMTYGESAESFCKEFCTIHEYPFQCSNGLVPENCSGGYNSAPRFFEINDGYVYEVLQKNDFKSRKVELLGH